MPYALIIIGIVMVVTAAQNTHSQLASQLKGDFIGQQNFTKWIIAIGGVGALGYVDELRGLSRAFMALIVIALFLSNTGVIAKFQQAINSGPALIPAPNADGTSTNTTNSGTSAGNTGLFGQSPGTPGDVGTSGQSKFNTYLNWFLGR